MEFIRVLYQSLVTFIQLLYLSLRREPPETTPTRCAILELPNELLNAIVTHLPQHSQMLISQTCRRFQAVAHRNLPAQKYRPDTSEERLLYLSQRARSLPDRWVCIECTKLHRINVSDTPAHSLYTLYDSKCRNGPEYHGQYGFRLSHIYVQLTLKYTRLKNMEPRYENYLKSLIAPYHTYLRPNNLDINKVKRKYSVYPKIVNGRYLLHTVRRYSQAKGPISMQSMGYISICPHREGPSLTGTLTEFYAGRMSLDTQAETNGRVNNDPRNGFDSSLYELLEKKLLLVYGRILAARTQLLVQNGLHWYSGLDVFTTISEAFGSYMSRETDIRIKQHMLLRFFVAQ
ncbi:F-box domain-containing protein [Trichoderma simmonsii]|uniref:F-box domain-containing protein n=1 Tax=Trichoderma simmonsii TaxID=1491479 RepID=A0A8G0PFH1_9HYPO|nr:F-box domain-containing protein [Trichoderma simmonsii]